MSNFLQTQGHEWERQGNTEEKEDGSQMEKPDCTDPISPDEWGLGSGPEQPARWELQTQRRHQQHLSEPEINNDLAEV